MSGLESRASWNRRQHIESERTMVQDSLDRVQRALDGKSWRMRFDGIEREYRADAEAVARARRLGVVEQLRERLAALSGPGA